MNASHSPAKIGKWTDYTTGEIWFVASAEWGYVIPAIVGVWLGFSAKYIKRILASFALFIHIRYNKPSMRRGGAPTPSTPLLDHQESPAEVLQDRETQKRAKVLAKVYKEGGGVRDLVQELVFNKDLSWKYRRSLLMFILLVSGATVGTIISGVYVARIKANGPAILDSQPCGLWTFNRQRGGDEAATRAGIHDLEKETRAGEYAQKCYEVPDMFDAIQCNFLYQSRLSFETANYTTDCPFKNEICRQNQTVSFVTDIIDASELGINSRSSPKFRRRTSCTPLSMEFPFIQNQTHDGTTTYYYYYGDKPLHDPPVNYTYKTTGDPFDRLAPAYDISAYTTSSTDIVESYWRPRLELTHPDFSTLTLLFISSLRILYKKWSDDPIFPADEQIFLSGEQKPWFRNSDPRARPLACINFIEVCLGDGKTCWPMNGHIPKDASGNLVVTPPEFWLMYASLLKTDIYNSIEKRLGRGLLAQKMVSQYFSEALGDHHWVNEVEHLVATSHARTQINAWSIASGEDSIHEGKDGYTLRTPEEIYGNLCGMFKYNPPGYASIHFIPLILILLTLPSFWLLSLKWVWITQNFKEEEATGTRRRPLEAGGVGQERPTPHPTDPAATLLRSGKTAKRNSDIAGQSGSSAANVSPDDRVESLQDRDSGGGVDLDTRHARLQHHAPRGLEIERPIAQLADPNINRGSQEGGAVTGIHDSTDVEWEPLVIEKIIQGIGVIGQRGWWLLVSLVWQWPNAGFEWLSHWWQDSRNVQ